MYSQPVDATRHGSWAAWIAISAIALYQQYLSPHKGWCCAYRVLTGKDSCSQYARHAIESVGFVAGLALIWTRLRTCGQAHLALSEQRGAKRGKNSRGSYAEGAKKDVAAEACCAGCNLLSWLKW